MEIVYFIIAGAVVGFAIGLTGIGGGSLMTPLLLLFGFPPHIAVGTDLLYAAITKAGGVASHHRQNTIVWPTVFALAAGSLPASILTVIALGTLFPSAESYQALITSSLGIMLIITSLVIIFRRQLINLVQYCNQRKNTQNSSNQANQKRLFSATFITGVVMGVLVTLSSVGAGAFCTAVLLVLYPALSSIRVVGTDIAHAIPLTFCAGLGHLVLGNVDYQLLAALLIGSLPAIHLGTRSATKLPESWLRPILASTLLGLGMKYTFF